MAVNEDAYKYFAEYVDKRKTAAGNLSTVFFADEVDKLKELLKDKFTLEDITDKLDNEDDLLKAVAYRLELTQVSALRRATQARYKGLHKHRLPLKHTVGSDRAAASAVRQLQDQLKGS